MPIGSYLTSIFIVRQIANQPREVEVAKDMSDFREWVDQNIKGDLPNASIADQKANDWGRVSGASNQSKYLCPLMCSPYRLKDLPSEY